MKYTEYLKTDHWKDIRAAKLHEANDRCENCKRKSGLQVHHLTYERVGNESLSDLKVLCERCHEKTHDLFPKYVDDWVIKITKLTERQQARVEASQAIHPLFKYVKPLVDGKLASFK